MATFQVIKVTPMESKPNATSSWRASLVKGLYTDEHGEMDTAEVMLFGERGQHPPVFEKGDKLIPNFGLVRNRDSGKMEFQITSFIRPAVASVSKAA